MSRIFIVTPVLLSTLLLLVKSQTWSAWSTWSNSSIKCVQERSRWCLNKSTRYSPVRLSCSGTTQEYRQTCSKVCSFDPWSLKASQCSRYNYMLVGNSFQEWIPVPHVDRLSPLDVDPCHLICQVVDTYYYHNFGYVDDGTLCGSSTDETLQICMKGKCTKLKRNSYPKCKQKATKCNKCKGRTCKKHKKVYFWKNSSRYKRGEKPALGYQHLMSLPRKASCISVQDRSSNYISVATSKNGILNDNWVVNPTGLYKGAGTIWTYQRQPILENLSAKGPLTTEVQIMVLAQNYEDTGVSVEYCLPMSARGGKDRKAGKTKKSCQKCKIVKRGAKNYCQSDFVTRAKVLNRDVVGRSNRYEVLIIQSFKNIVPLINKEYIWTNSTCACPNLEKNEEYLLMGKVDTNYRGNELRLMVNPRSFIRKYSVRVARRIMQIQSREYKYCEQTNNLSTRRSG